MTAEHPLLGAQLRRVDAPWPDVLALSISARNLRGALLIALAAGARGIGLVDRRPEGDEATPFVLRARKALAGGRIGALELHAHGLRIAVRRGGELLLLETRTQGARGNALLFGADGALVTALHAIADARPDDSSGAPLDLPDLDALRARGAELLRELSTASAHDERSSLERSLRQAEKRLARRLAAVEGDRARIEQVAELRRKAQLVVANLHALPKGGGTLELLDHSVDPPAQVAITIDPALGPRQQAEAWFHSARRIERGAAVAAERAQRTREELSAVHALIARLALAEDPAAFAALRTEADRLGVAVPAAAPRAPGRPAPAAPRLPYRRFTGSGGRPIFVGRGASDNDRLTLEHARPHDLWLHARDSAGAHVVVPLERGEACPPELLCDAATLAAHFSQSRGERRVDVVYVERRYVRKPRKSPIGQVTLEREKVFRLDLEPARLDRLLKAEASRNA